MRIAALSPFVDRRHGTERALAETLERLVRIHGYEVHLYSQSVQDLAVVSSAHISTQPGIIWHLLRFLFWFAANRFCRLRDRWFRGIRFDAVFSPGINATDANLVLVHAVFHRLNELQGSRSSGGLRDLHRSLYYRLLRGLENRVYRQKNVRLAAVSQHAANQLSQYFGRQGCCHRSQRRRYFPLLTLRTHPAAAPGAPNVVLPRRSSLAPSRTNDPRNKGLPTLLQALTQCRDLSWHLCVVGSDSSAGYSAEIEQRQPQGRVTFAGETADILTYYSAADVSTSRLPWRTPSICRRSKPWPAVCR